jgi:hypothetical protein
MKNGRATNGGHSTVSSKPIDLRKRQDSQKLIELLSPLTEKGLLALSEGLDRQDPWAVKLWFNYMFGKPKTTTDIVTNGKEISILPIEWVE